MKWAIKNKIAVGVATTFAVLVINAGVTYRNTLQTITDSSWVDHSEEVLTALENTFSTLKEAETGQRGYLITGQEDYLEPYHNATKSVNEYLQQVKNLTVDNPIQQQRMIALQGRIARKFLELNQTIILRQKKGFAAAQQVVSFGQGKQEMDQIRDLVTQMENEERQLLQRRTKEVKTSAQQTILTFSIASGVSLALLGLVFYLVRRDFIQRSKAERTLRQSEARFRRIVESNILGFVFAEFSGKIIEANDAYLQIIGYTRGELLSGKVDGKEITPPEYWDYDRQSIVQVQQTGFCPPFEKEYIRKDGSRIPIVIGVALIDAANKEQHVSFVLDLSKQKAAEAEVRKLNQTLEQRVHERTGQLEAANQEMQAFSYSVSHDLRAPLRAMQGFAQALLEDYGNQIDDLGQEYAHRIVAAAGRMETLIQDLLSYSRLSRAELGLQQVNLTAVMMEVLTQLESELKERQAQVRVENPMPQVIGHYSTLVQIVANLLSNAIKFVSAGIKPQVRVWAENRGNDVRLWVQDNGIGIASEHQHRIFSVFERLHGTEAYPGTGIGLAIVRKGVERLGGRVGVESQPTQGSCFWVELPRQ